MDIPWPQQGDRLFVPGGAGALHAHVLREPFPFPVEGYKRAGDILVQWLRENSRDDALVFPVAFCYRQYMEVRLKEIIVLLDRLHGIDKKYTNTHDLSALWSKLLDKIDKNDYHNEKEAFEAVGECIAEFHRIDSRGTGFRYKEHMDISQIDLHNLQSIMDKIAIFLDSLTDMLSNAVENGL